MCVSASYLRGGHWCGAHIAGRDIVSSGTGLGSTDRDATTWGVLRQQRQSVRQYRLPTCRWQAGATSSTATSRRGTGQLEISAGRNLLMNDEVAVTSLGGGRRRATRAPMPASSCRRAPARRTTPASSALPGARQPGAGRNALAEQPGKGSTDHENE